jgi:uncharacterized protein (DUF305 family)
MHAHHYGRLLIMTVLSFISMYVLMYAMVDTFANVYPNFNQFYMAGLMTAPMVLIELLLMRSMYNNKKANITIIAVSIVALAAFFLMIRQQTAIADTQFLKSMIPHHAAAILMCGKAPIQDAEIRQLCRAIIDNQSSEIAQMKAKLRVLER